MLSFFNSIRAKSIVIIKKEFFFEPRPVLRNKSRRFGKGILTSNTDIDRLVFLLHRGLGGLDSFRVDDRVEYHS